MNWRTISDADEVAHALVALFANRGGARYDEALSQTEHAVQAAALARAADATDEQVAAALLHDVGHLLEPEHRPMGRTRDLHHEDLGARFLAAWFGPEVTEPIRLHVAAKRYLCAVDPAYLDSLSPASMGSLGLQGGVMSAVEAIEFTHVPGGSAAAQLRRWDDLAKRTDVSAGAFDDHHGLLARLVRAPAA